MAIDLMGLQMPRKEGSESETAPEEMEEMEEVEEEMPESPLASFSDDEIMEEAKARGLI